MLLSVHADSLSSIWQAPIQSTGYQHPASQLSCVALSCLQGSLLLGTVTRLALGGDTLTSNEVFISPLAIAGWCGLVTTSLNMLPVGCLDGGRMVQVG